MFKSADEHEFIPNLHVGVFDRAEVNIWSLMSFDMWRRFESSPHALALGMCILPVI